MTQDRFGALVASAVLERTVLLLNHVLAGEPQAARRLAVHAGRRIECKLDGWPGLLPPLPVLAFGITPAGLLEWCGPDAAPAAADLHLAVDASNPAALLLRALGGERPAISIQGDAALATELNWLIDNLHWDVEDDLARLAGAGPAHQIASMARPVAQGLRAALRGVSAAVGRSAGRGAR